MLDIYINWIYTLFVGKEDERALNTMKCEICKRTLKANESVARGIGPECAGKYSNGIQAAGSTVAGIAKLEALDAPTVNRWLNVAKQAIGRNRIQEAQRFIEAAEQAALDQGDKMAELKHVFIPACDGEPAESYDQYTCECGVTNDVFDYRGETFLPCECGKLVMVSGDLAPLAMAA